MNTERPTQADTGVPKKTPCVQYTQHQGVLKGESHGARHRETKAP